MKPLENITVIDLTRILSGPYCTMILADFGARVIKIEVPGQGDESRLLAPHINKESGYFMSVNRGKQSVTLDLRTSEGQELLKELVRKADILVENYRPGTMDKWGLGYEELKKINPRLIYTSVSGFGHSGPYMKLPAYDIVIQGMSGIMSITGQPGGQPTRVGTSIGDIVPGLFTTAGIMMALYSRTFTGEGQRLDIAMFDSLVAILENALIRYQADGAAPQPIGNRHPVITPFDSFSTKDGYVIVAAGNPKLFEKLCAILNLPEVLSDPRFSDPHARHVNVDALKQILEKAFSSYTQAQALELLSSMGIPSAPINTIDQVMNDPQVAARQMIVDVEHPIAGILKLAGIPIKMSLTPGEVHAPAPLLGQHTEEVLSGFLGLTKQQIDGLRERKVI
ncbi:MAG: CoA transferase [Deltaproteobacteria bacterium]